MMQKFYSSTLNVNTGEIEQLELDYDPVEDTLNTKRYFARQQRNSKLQATDWSQLADIPQATKDKYAVYRQALRDVPLQPGFPLNFEWPSEPD